MASLLKSVQTLRRHRHRNQRQRCLCEQPCALPNKSIKASAPRNVLHLRAANAERLARTMSGLRRGLVQRKLGSDQRAMTPLVPETSFTAGTWALIKHVSSLYAAVPACLVRRSRPSTQCMAARRFADRVGPRRPVPRASTSLALQTCGFMNGKDKVGAGCYGIQRYDRARGTGPLRACTYLRCGAPRKARIWCCTLHRRTRR
jgi:hypothetical protein